MKRENFFSTLLELNYFRRHSFVRWAQTALAVLLIFAPAVFIAHLISRYGVDIPFADEWEWAPFLFKAHQHSLTVADLFAQHNEHRYFFPKLILLVLTPLTSGNTKGLMFFSVAIASGWAVIPKGLRPADAVLLTYDDSVKGPVAFAVAAPSTPRPEVVDALHDARYEYSGWLCKFRRSTVPAGDQLITAWSLDADKMVVRWLITQHTLP